MQILFVLSFLIIFAVIFVSAALGFRLLEAQRKQKVSSMLATASGKIAHDGAPLLLDALSGRRTVLSTLERFNFVRALEVKMQQSGLDWTVGGLLARMAVFGCIGAVIGWLVPLLLSPAVTAPSLAVLFGSLPYFYVMSKRKKRLEDFEKQFPEALDFLARAMRAGHAFSVSLEMLAEESDDPLGVEFRQLFNEQNLGAPLEVAMQNLAARMPILDVRFFVSAVLLQRETGGNLAEVLTKLAYVIRERFRLKGQVRAASAHGKLTAMVLTFMPAITGLLLIWVSPDYLNTMAKDPDGKYLIVFALVAQALGYYWMKWIIDIKV